MVVWLSERPPDSPDSPEGQADMPRPIEITTYYILGLPENADFFKRLLKAVERWQQSALQFACIVNGFGHSMTSLTEHLRACRDSFFKMIMGIHNFGFEALLLLPQTQDDDPHHQTDRYQPTNG